jgi:hypothetical protein
VRPVRYLILVIVAVLALSGCGAGGDTSFYVKNTSSQSWYLSVSRGFKDGDLWVVGVAPGADTFALSWNGGPTQPIKVLGPDCSVVGTFRPAADGTWVIDAVPGLTGHMEAHGAPLGSRVTTPGVVDTEDCGGFLSA